MPEAQIYMPKVQNHLSKDAAKVAAMARQSGHSSHLSQDKQQLFLGDFKALNFPSELRLHAMDAVELVTAQSSLTLHPSLSLGILLEGRLRFHLGGKRYDLLAKRSAPLFFAMNTLAPSKWLRELHAGQKVRKLVLSVSVDWLANRAQLCKKLQPLLCRHNYVQSCCANKALVEQAESLLNAMPEGEDFGLEVAAFQLFETAYQFIQSRFAMNRDWENTGAQGASCSRKTDLAENIHVSKQQSLAMRVRHFLESEIIPNAGLMELDLPTLARELGSSSSTLQRKFKQAFAITIYEYLRERKLQLAKEALIKHNISIGEAAYLAGYKHYPNFVSAFKSMFGQSPGAWKAQILQGKS